jgi:energy-coupling factor transporter transmembrane protein EcfT
MAQRLALHYFPGNSILHRWDARCKLIGLATVTVTLLRTTGVWLLLNSILLFFLLILSRLPVRSFLRDLRHWFLFLAMLFVFQVLFSNPSGTRILPGVPISAEGLRLGALNCWRIGIILGYSVLFTAVTRPREIQNSLMWFLKPLPLVPARRIGFMVSLSLRFISTVLDQTEEVWLAHKARLGDRKQNPVRKMKLLGLPIIRRSFNRVEDVTFALIARGFREDLPLDLPELRISHLIPILILLTFIVVFW